jgi:hypothetical protein
VLLGEWFLMLWRSMTVHRKELVMWMWNPEAFGDIYIVTFQKNTVNYTAVKIPIFARSLIVYVVHVGTLLKWKFRYTYSGSLFL